MPEEARYLITTADERSWKLDRPVLFLGEWCRLYRRKDAWSKLDAIVAEPYGLNQKQKDRDEARVRSLEQVLFPLLCEALNRHHGTTHSERFWKILLGHWMRTYLSVMFNRISALRSCLDSHAISGFTAIVDERYSLAVPDSLSATLCANDDTWNQVLYHRILSRLGAKGFAVEVLSASLGGGYQRAASIDALPLKRRLLRAARRLATAAARMLMRDSDAMVIGSYLPLLEEAKLQFALGQMPQLWRSPPLEMVSGPDRKLRREFAEKMERHTNDTVSDVMHAMLFELLPVCYLEGFAELSRQVGSLDWPRRPKLIFTSNNFDSDEVFKLWSARQAEAGTRYVAGQHGGNYGSRRIPHRSVEELISDKFLTWGWTDGLPQHVPAFLLNTAGGERPLPRPDPDGGLLLVLEALNHRIPVWDDIGEFARRWSDQLTFVDTLSAHARSRLVVRLHAAFRRLSWSELERLRDFDPKLHIDTGEHPIARAIAASRLIVFSYDSSGFYEALSGNFPTITFSHTGLDFIRESAKPLFRRLVEVGIFHLSPGSAAQKVNEISGGVAEWWARPAIQDARSEFCARFANSSATPIADLKNLLLR